MKTIQFEPLAGTHIGHACKEAVALAINKQAHVSFSFNGVSLTATPESTPHGLLKEWETERDRQRKEYEASPECAAEKARREDQICKAQEVVDSFMDGIEHVLCTCSTDSIMEYLKPFVAAADDIGVKFDKAKLADILESAGYANNMHVGKPPEAFNERIIMAEYILGQAVNCLRSGMPPHQVTNSFIERYFAIPSETAIAA